MEMTMKTGRGGICKKENIWFGKKEAHTFATLQCRPWFQIAARHPETTLWATSDKDRQIGSLCMFYVFFILWRVVNFFAAVLMLVDVCGQVASGWGYWEWETATDREGHRESSFLLEVENEAKADRIKKPHKGVEYGPTRGYIVIYRGPGLLSAVWFCSFPNLSSQYSVSSTGDTQDWETTKLLTGKGGEQGWRGVESYDRKKALFSIKHSLHSVPHSSFDGFLSWFNTWIHGLRYSLLYIVPMEIGG